MLCRFIGSSSVLVYCLRDKVTVRIKHNSLRFYFGSSTKKTSTTFDYI